MSPRWSTPLVIVLLVHAALDVALLFQPWNFPNRLLLVAVAIPVSQNALAAIWACTHSSPSYVRCVLLSIGLVATWYVAISVLSWPSSSDSAAGWGAAFVVQSLVIVFLVTVARRAMTNGTSGRRGPGSVSSHGYSLATMLLWVAALTVPLVLFRLSMTQLGWSTRIFEWEFFPHVMVVGAYNGLYAVVVLWSTAGRGFVWRPIAAACLLVAISFCEVPLIDFTFAGAGMEIGEALLFAGAQTLILYATLIPLRLAGRRATQNQPPRPHAVVPPRSVPAQEVQVRVHK